MRAAREAARRSQCVNNLKQIGLALRNSLSTNNVFPLGHRWLPTTPDHPESRGTIGGLRLILPAMEQTALYSDISFNYGCRNAMGQRRAGPVNSTAANAKIAAFLCPLRQQRRPGQPQQPPRFDGHHPREQSDGQLGDVHLPDELCRIEAATDGSSNTVAFSEALASDKGADGAASRATGLATLAATRGRSSR